MQTVFVRPAPPPAGAARRIVLMPERGMTLLPEEGAEVPLDQYWQARLRDGDVLEATPATSSKPGKKSA